MRELEMYNNNTSVPFTSVPFSSFSQSQNILLDIHYDYNKILVRFS